VNTQVARRPFPELYDAVGCFINSVLVRTDVEGDPSFAELLGRVRSFALAAYAHQDMPYVRLIEALEPLHYRRARRPQILFDYYHHRQLAEADDELRLPELEVEPVPVPARSAPINAFNFSVLERGDGSLAAHVSFAREEERELFESLAGDFHRTLTAGIAAPETRVSKLVPEPAQ
jgi:non-ribosomal peptide synthetase component F